MLCLQPCLHALELEHLNASPISYPTVTRLGANLPRRAELSDEDPLGKGAPVQCRFPDALLTGASRNQNRLFESAELPQRGARAV